jgi:hypothetical protein
MPGWSMPQRRMWSVAVWSGGNFLFWLEDKNNPTFKEAAAKNKGS